MEGGNYQNKVLHISNDIVLGIKMESKGEACTECILLTPYFVITYAFNYSY